MRHVQLNVIVNQPSIVQTMEKIMKYDKCFRTQIRNTDIIVIKKIHDVFNSNRCPKGSGIKSSKYIL